MSNKEIVEYYLNNGLIQTCVDCQFSKIQDKQFKDDFFQDLCIILLTYDNDKMMDAHQNGHFNALVSRIIINQIYSVTSPYYRDYYKYLNKMRDYIPDDYKIPDSDIRT